MALWSLEDGEKVLTKIDTDEVLEEILIEIYNNLSQGKIVILTHPEGYFMHIGLSKEIGFLNYHNASDKPPYYSSVGNSNLKLNDDDVKEFYINGSLIEIPLRNCIPFDQLLLVVKHFFNTGKLSNMIEWEED